jgi:hypothetical protein
MWIYASTPPYAFIAQYLIIKHRWTTSLLLLRTFNLIILQGLRVTFYSSAVGGRLPHLINAVLREVTYRC